MSGQQNKSQATFDNSGSGKTLVGLFESTEDGKHTANVVGMFHCSTIFAVWDDLLVWMKQFGRIAIVLIQDFMSIEIAVSDCK